MYIMYVLFGPSTWATGSPSSAPWPGGQRRGKPPRGRARRCKKRSISRPLETFVFYLRFHSKILPPHPRENQYDNGFQEAFPILKSGDFPRALFLLGCGWHWGGPLPEYFEEVPILGSLVVFLGEWRIVRFVVVVEVFLFFLECE